MTIKCRICRGVRNTNGRVCLGCGTPVANAIDRNKPKRARPTCPICGPRPKVSEVQPGRFECGGCRSHFEADDVGYVDTRPDVNAEKRERVKR